MNFASSKAGKCRIDAVGVNTHVAANVASSIRAARRRSSSGRSMQMEHGPAQGKHARKSLGRSDEHR